MKGLHGTSQKDLWFDDMNRSARVNEAKVIKKFTVQHRSLASILLIAGVSTSLMIPKSYLCPNRRIQIGRFYTKDTLSFWTNLVKHL